MFLDGFWDTFFFDSFDYSKYFKKRHLRHDSHYAAGNGNLEKLKTIAKKRKDAIFQPDWRGHQPIHEAARRGHMEVVKWLIDQGADINAKTTKGMDVLELVEHHLGEDHPMYELLANIHTEL